VATFGALGFATNYEVQLDPELAPEDDWGMHALPLGLWPSRTALEPVAIVTPAGLEPWVGMVPPARPGTLLGTPSPDAMVRLPERGQRGGAFIPVRSPEAMVPLETYMALPTPVHDLGLLLLVEFTEIVAVGADGILWRSGRIVLDKLRVTKADATGIFCEGTLLDFQAPSRVVLDPKTGAQIGGADYRDVFGINFVERPQSAPNEA
jgi:hypothetical protein